MTVTGNQKYLKVQIFKKTLYSLGLYRRIFYQTRKSTAGFQSLGYSNLWANAAESFKKNLTSTFFWHSHSSVTFDEAELKNSPKHLMLRILLIQSSFNIKSLKLISILYLNESLLAEICNHTFT